MLITKFKLNRYFYHIVGHLVLHLIFTIAFGSILSSGIPHETNSDAFLYLWASVAFIYNLIASGFSLLGLIILETSLKKKLSHQISKTILFVMRFCVLVSQTLYFFTCLMLAIAYGKRDEYSKETKPLTNLSIAYTIIGFWHIFLGTLHLLSRNKKEFEKSSNAF